MAVKTINEVLDAAKRVTTYIQNNDKTPSSIKVGSLNVTRASFNRMMAATLIEIDNKSMQNILTNTIKEPPKPIGGLPDGQLQKSEYLDIAKRVKDYIAKKEKMPNYITTSLGKMSPFNYMDIFSRILNYYVDKKVLPSFAYTSSLSVVSNTPKVVSYPANIKPFLDVTKNCNWKDALIVNKVKDIVGNETSMYNKAYKLFNWALNVTSYEEPMYYNTRHGAVNTLKLLKGNCVDLAHLLIALWRAAGIPALYKHVYAQFSNFKTGHVIASAYIDGKWIDGDLSNNINKLGNTKSWKLIKQYAVYKELPF
jgi:hypothetical protein